ncbi:2,3-bisphosphoglycerate-independent phosphoglycerate mutase [Fundidesulfovibrio magnetotacticus]|uniref:2,3-bisphosphoglycerate-independent phosphoglycerate mutase n=1 Tax=Fundidesulfovibrio magnetotacticus TaxID=2730080 RepID=A0A6V8LXC5_9BACT|nr:2,3-bisphosphoglycerate-independent phosphoglycerate mutase [Fundidesulfovibrio magnetotacticus]GFK95540.1 2,3-bisphosphoglycerate-independent phosphoglycerate mutase [Fundidesulfovibrio magnetotacticus]
MNPGPTLLLILDGWGLAPAGPGNAVTLAHPACLEGLAASRPTARLKCSGRSVGLPDGFMGNSEVGHMNIGAGRVVYQDMTRIDVAIEEGALRANPVLKDLASAVKASGGSLQLMGLVSDGGVHSHLKHLEALLETFQALGVSKVYVHCFLDGRDTPPSSGAGYVQALTKAMERIGCGAVASVTGRFYAMDRDKRWERVAEAYAALTSGQGILAADPVEAVRQAYAEGQTDEFVKPRLMAGPDGRPQGLIGDGDAVFFFNFRADRAREITRAFTDPAFDAFPRAKVPQLAGFATMTEYDASFGLPCAFGPEEITQTLGQVFSEAGMKQLRIAETEKYAHVTYFLNGGREEPFPGEERLLVPSPREVATYDLKPRMSAPEVTDALVAALDKGYGLVVCNLANLDMVGHTGVLEAAVEACRTVDGCVERILAAVLARGGRALVTADHGNAEEMIDASGGPMTAHTLNEVPVILVDPSRPGAKLADGRLADVAPTILEMAGLPKPAAMTGTSLLRG